MKKKKVKSLKEVKKINLMKKEKQKNKINYSFQ